MGTDTTIYLIRGLDYNSIYINQTSLNGTFKCVSVYINFISKGQKKKEERKNEKGSIKNTDL